MPKSSDLGFLHKSDDASSAVFTNAGHHETHGGLVPVLLQGALKCLGDSCFLQKKVRKLSFQLITKSTVFINDY